MLLFVDLKKQDPIPEEKENGSDEVLEFQTNGDIVERINGKVRRESLPCGTLYIMQPSSMVKLTSEGVIFFLQYVEGDQYYFTKENE